MNEDFITSQLPSSVQVEQEKSPEQKSIEREQEQADYSLAALKDHPGWKQIKDQMEKDIDDFKSFRNIDLSRYDNAELGEVVRTERMVADKLEVYMYKIENAVKAVVEKNDGRTG